MDDKTRNEIGYLHRGGESVKALALHFGLSESRVSRILAQAQYARICQFPLNFIPNERFSRMSAGQQRRVLAPMPPSAESQPKVRRPAGLPPYLASMYETPLLTREQEQHLFRKLNYLKYKAARLVGRLNPAGPSVLAMREIERLYEESLAVKNDIVQANLRLVVSIAKRYASAVDTLFELISDGNVSLMRAVEKFDFARGFRFSTYASWAIIMNFARSIPTEFRRRSRFHTTQTEMLSATADLHGATQQQEAVQSERVGEVAKILHYLDDREKQIISYRFGLGPSRKPMTLKEVGMALGVTKERIRQLETRAMDKLRVAAEAERLEAPGPD
ncbi:MAG: sigma-70 family RNA polymerase sigma factor [Thermoguttaceae bacterium]